MALYVYDNGQRLELADPKAYVAGARHDVDVAYAYEGGQRHLVWEREPLALTANATAWNSVSLSWVGPSGSADSFTLKRGSTTIYTGANRSYTDGGRAASTSYTYSLEAWRGGVKVDSDSATVKTPARPTQQKTVTLDADWIQSWRGSGSKRTDNGYMYHGWDSYSSPAGYYVGAAKFPIPSDVRNCKSVDKVEIRFYNIHTYNGTGADYYLGYHTSSSEPSGKPATTRKAWIHVAKPGWYGYANHTSAFATALRTGNMWGYSFGPGTSSNVSQYGYADSNKANHLLRITYTVYV